MRDEVTRFWEILGALERLVCSLTARSPWASMQVWELKDLETVSREEELAPDC